MWRTTSALLLFLAAPALATNPLGWNNASFTASNAAIPVCDLVKMSSEDWVNASGVANLTPTVSSAGWVTGFTGAGATNASAYVRASMLIDLDHTDYPEYCDSEGNIIVGATSGTRCDAHYPESEYTIDCAGGTGKVGIGRDADSDPTLTCPGSTTFTVSAATSNGLEIKVFAVPAITGTPVVRVYPSGANPMACDPDDDVFNPAYKRFLVRSKAYGMRHTGWMETFAQTTIDEVVDWADRKALADRTWVSVNDTDGKGVPPELPVMLSQELFEDLGWTMIPWLVFPVGASNDYHTNFATWVEANLDSSIPVWLEWCNECWNTGAAYNYQFNFVLSRANAASITGSNLEKVQKYQSGRSAEVYELWKTAFGGLTRLKRILGIQAKECCSPSDLSTYVGYAIPGALTTVDDYLDYVAIAPYLTVGDGLTTHGKHSLRGDNASYDVVSNSQCGTDAAHITGQGTAEYSCCGNLSCTGMRDWSDDQFCDSLRANLESQRLQTATHKTAVEAHTNAEAQTLRLIFYEGGPNHDDHGGGSQANQTGEWDQTFVAVHQRAHRSGCMTDLTRDYLSTMYAEVGDQPLFMLLDIAKWTKFQHFGFSEYLIDSDGSLNYCKNGTACGAISWANEP